MAIKIKISNINPVNRCSPKTGKLSENGTFLGGLNGDFSR